MGSRVPGVAHSLEAAGPLDPPDDLHRRHAVGLVDVQNPPGDGSGHYWAGDSGESGIWSARLSIRSSIWLPLGECFVEHEFHGRDLPGLESAPELTP